MFSLFVNAWFAFLSFKNTFCAEAYCECQVFLVRVYLLDKSQHCWTEQLQQFKENDMNW